MADTGKLGTCDRACDALNRWVYHRRPHIKSNSCMNWREQPWIETKSKLPPDGLVVDTKIDDKDGCRNEQALKRGGNLWWYPDGSMYVYYSPTHWREQSAAEPAQGEPFAGIGEFHDAANADSHAKADSGISAEQLARKIEQRSMDWARAYDREQTVAEIVALLDEFAALKTRELREERDALKQRVRLRTAIAELNEQGQHAATEARWQDAIYKLCRKIVGPENESYIDGSGSDTGDALDVTLSEIRQMSGLVVERAESALAGMRSKTLDEAAKARLEGRLVQFERTIKLRPIDPAYWDMHEEESIRSALLGLKGEPAPKEGK